MWSCGTRQTGRRGRRFPLTSILKIGKLKRNHFAVGWRAAFTKKLVAPQDHRLCRMRSPCSKLHGEQGSAKSTTERILRALIDPHEAPLRAGPRDGRDLIIAATNGWIVPLDNISYVRPWLSDALCRLATGGGFTTRELYSDSEEVIFNAQRPTLLNGIEEFITRPDLLDRAIPLALPTIPEEQRKQEATLWPEFETARPMILGSLLDAVSFALRNEEHVKLTRLPRMADFAIWVSAAEPYFGWKAGDFAGPTRKAVPKRIASRSTPQQSGRLFGH